MPYVTLAKKKDKLDGSVKKAEMTFLEKLQENDEAPGLHIEPIKNSQDSRVRTGRVNDMWRAVLFKLPTPNDTHYVYWGTWQHDKAIEKAKSSVLRVNPVFGFTEIIESSMPEMPQPPTDPDSEPSADSAWSNGLVEFGWSQEALEKEAGIHDKIAKKAVDATTQQAFYKIVDKAPDVQGLILLGLSKGQSLADVKEELDLEDYEDDPKVPEEKKIIEGGQKPPVQGQFRFVGDNPEELRQVLESSDFEAWRTFLHPAQKQYATKSWKGSFRLSGGAGTGKTVVLLHRAKSLAERNPDSRIVLTTFTRTLASSLVTNLKKLDPNLPEASQLGKPGIVISGIDQIAYKIVFEASDSERTAAIAEVLGTSHHSLRNRQGSAESWSKALSSVDHGLDTDLANTTFLEQEYIGIVLANFVTTRDEYLKVPRVGRGTALNRKKRLAVWQIVDAYRQVNQLDEIITFPEIAALAVAILRRRASAGEPRLADHVLVDEAQDFHAAHWLLLRELASAGTDDLFIAEDSHQRIYGQKVPLSRFGIAIVGRSRRLTLNYRTTAQNLAYAVGILKGAKFQDIEGEAEKSDDYRSARTGPAPVQVAANGSSEELTNVAERLTAWREAGVRGDTIGILARTQGQLKELQTGLAAKGITVRDVDHPGDGAAPLMMTMHRAKGMEFSKVVLLGVNSDKLPLAYQLSNLPEAELQDVLMRERSLLYVAATRARDELIVSWNGKPSSLLLNG